MVREAFLLLAPDSCLLTPPLACMAPAPPDLDNAWKGCIVDFGGSIVYSSFIFLGLWCVIGYIILMFVRDRKNKREREKEQKEALRKALCGDEEEEGVAELERFFGKKGK